MPSPASTVRGSVVALWRYPVKSMMGEALNAAEVSERGLLGDRAYALVDGADGKVVSAKNPRKWPRLFDYRAALADAAPRGVEVPAVRITLPDGTTVSSEQPDVHQILSRALSRDVTLRATERRAQAVVASAPAGPQTGTAEEYWPDIDGLDYRDVVTEFNLPEGTFFDASAVHVLTTATLDRLRELYPNGRFEARRFRPNVVVEVANGEVGFPENAWVGHTLVLGETIRLRVDGLCPRCVMTTLSQDDLPKNTGILRTAAQHNQASVGVYASVLRGGTVRRGDAVSLE
jgi:uncharacterized protein